MQWLVLSSLCYGRRPAAPSPAASASFVHAAQQAQMYQPVHQQMRGQLHAVSAGNQIMAQLTAEASAAMAGHDQLLDETACSNTESFPHVWNPGTDDRTCLRAMALAFSQN